MIKSPRQFSFFQTAISECVAEVVRLWTFATWPQHLVALHGLMQHRLVPGCGLRPIRATNLSPQRPHRGVEGGTDD